VTGARQLAFDLPARSTFARADFFVTPSTSAALAALDGWRDWPHGRLLLTGPAGAGKTHLAHIWAAEAGATLVCATDLGRADLPALAATRAVVVEDAETLPDADAALLFHLHNMLQGTGHLLITAATPPRDWRVTLPDLASRMQAMPSARVAPPDDTLLSAVLVKLFADRQIAVSASLISYLAVRMDRSLHAARQLVAALDALALARGRPITRALAAEVLDKAANA
jgi:chromosomal replication initiation ATPase DnaA